MLDRGWDQGPCCKIGCSVEKPEEVPFVLMRYPTGESDVAGRRMEESESRLTMRALGRSASSKIKQGWDWK